MTTTETDFIFYIYIHININTRLELNLHDYLCVKVLIATAKDLKNVYQWEELWVWPAACYVAKQALARAVLYMMLPSTDENKICPYSFNANKNSECKYFNECFCSMRPKA